MLNSLFSNFRRQTYVVSAKLNFLRGRTNESISTLKKALEEFPNDTRLLSDLQKTYERIEDWDSFFEVYRLAESRFPDSLQIKRNLGTALLDSGQYKEALPYLQYCVANWNLDPSFSNALANTHGRLGICYAYLTEWDLAKSSLLLAESKVPWDLDVIYGKILLFMGTNRSQEIPKYLDDKIKKYPRFYALYYWKAFYTHLYHYNAADSLTWYQAALDRINYFKLRREYFPYYFTTGSFAVPELILAQYLEALVICNKNKEAQYMLWSSKFKYLDADIDFRALQIRLDVLTNHAKKGEDKCLRIVNNKKKTAVYWSLLALAQAAQEKTEDGIFSAKKALALNSRQIEALETLGRLQMTKGDWNSAIATFKKALDLDPLDPSYLESMGTCYANVNNFEQARALYEYSASLSPHNAHAWVGLGKTYLNLGEEELARSACERALTYKYLTEDKRQLAMEILNSLKIN